MFRLKFPGSLKELFTSRSPFVSVKISGVSKRTGFPISGFPISRISDFDWNAECGMTGMATLVFRTVFALRNINKYSLRNSKHHVVRFFPVHFSRFLSTPSQDNLKTQQQKMPKVDEIVQLISVDGKNLGTMSYGDAILKGKQENFILISVNLLKETPVFRLKAQADLVQLKQKTAILKEEEFRRSQLSKGMGKDQQKRLVY